MKTLKTMYRFCDRLLKIYQIEDKKGNKYLRGMLYEFKYDRKKMSYEPSLVSSKDFKDVDVSDYSSIFKIKKYFDIVNGNETTCDKFININHRVIWRNDDYNEWVWYAKRDGEYENKEITYDTYSEECFVNLNDERRNLNVDVDGCIVAFADLGLWDGRHNGAKVVGTNVAKILYSDCDYVDWYCDRYNVRCDASHHDGTNHMIYRVAKSYDDAEKIVNAVAYEGMTEDEFIAKTKSLRPYVAKVYGF